MTIMKHITLFSFKSTISLACTNFVDGKIFPIYTIPILIQITNAHITTQHPIIYIYSKI